MQTHLKSTRHQQNHTFRQSRRQTSTAAASSKLEKRAGSIPASHRPLLVAGPTAATVGTPSRSSSTRPPPGASCKCGRGQTGTAAARLSTRRSTQCRAAVREVAASHVEAVASRSSREQAAVAERARVASWKRCAGSPFGARPTWPCRATLLAEQA